MLPLQLAVRRRCDFNTILFDYSARTETCVRARWWCNLRVW
jgi:hypothetical protein